MSFTALRSQRQLTALPWPPRLPPAQSFPRNGWMSLMTMSQVSHFRDSLLFPTICSIGIPLIALLYSKLPLFQKLLEPRNQFPCLFHSIGGIWASCTQAVCVFPHVRPRLSLLRGRAMGGGLPLVETTSTNDHLRWMEERYPGRQTLLEADQVVLQQSQAQ